MLYTSIDNQKIKDLKKLQTKKYRDKKGLFLGKAPELIGDMINVDIGIELV